ncbi:T9SS type A sorting domain-containing protein [Flavobacterium sp. LaA7.5]|nr:T9SS type A sorting domain-containing protein [Flavobacterium salilacus subsp. altitudinum]
MKKTLLLGLFLFGGIIANAQIADGSDAPDFSGTDVVTGETVSLQDYLDQGITVVAYMSAAWCGPCWSFHNTHYLSDIHYAYGEDGSNEVVVIYIESDPRTMEGEIFGEDLPPAPGYQAAPSPLGDWTLDTPYHIINNDIVSSSYDIPGYPTMFAICPQGAGQPGIVHEIDRGTPEQLTQYIGTSCTAVEGIANLGKPLAENLRFCEGEGSISGSFKSYGSNTITSATAQLKKDGTVIATKTFEGLSIAQFQTTELAFDSMELDGQATYQIELTQLNGATPANTSPEFVNSKSFTIVPNAATESSQNIKVTLYTDEFPAEMKAYILDSNDNTVWSSPDYTAGNAEQMFHYEITLDLTDCYTVALTDAYGDGWTWNQAGAEVPHGILVESADNTVLFYNNGDFGQLLYQNATFTTNGTLAGEKFNDAGFGIYPNPSTGIFYLSSQDAVDVTVLDLTGKIIHTQNGVTNGDAIDLNKIQSGIYIAKVVSENNTEKVVKLVIE